MNELQNGKKYLLGIDIGGSHITAGLISLADNTLVEESLIRKRVNSKGVAKDIIETWAQTIKEIDQLYPGSYKHIGIAMPGPFDYEKGISLILGFDKYESLYRMDVRRLLADELGIVPQCIRFKNDAAAFLEGELIAGVAQGFNNCIGVTLGTGLGTAWSLDGNTVDAELSAKPFQEGITEDYISTRWFVKRYFDLTGNMIRDTKDLADIYAGNEAAVQVFREFSEHFALFLEDFIRQHNPEILVIGGNMAKAAPLFLEQTKQSLNGVAKSTTIKLATLGETAALIGGAGCWKEEYEMMK